MKHLADLVVLACALAAGACMTPEKQTRAVEFRGPLDAELILGGATHRLPCATDVEPERALPLTLQIGPHVFAGSFALSYAPRAELVAEFDPRLLDAAADEPLTLFGWASDFLGECDLVFVVAASDGAADVVATRELAERYTGAASQDELGSVFGWSILAALGGGGPVPRAQIEARHAAGAAWIDERGVAHGLCAGDALAFVRTRDSRAWIGPLRARGGSATRGAPEFEAALADTLPRHLPLPAFAVGDGRHGMLALGLAWTQDDRGAARLRLDARLDPDAAEIAIVIAERGTPSALSSPSARVVAASGGRAVIVWSPGAGELARGPIELGWRRASRGGAP